MPAGRPPMGPRLVDSVEADAATKKKLKLILETISGQRSVEDAAAEMGVSTAYFHELRARALAAAADSLEPRPTGRPSKPSTSSSDETSSLKEQINRLEVELEAARIREEIALVMPQVLAPKKNSSILDKLRFSRRRKSP